MTCTKCGSSNVNVQMVSESQLKNKHHSILYWLFIGWWWIPLLWICLTMPMIFVKLFGHKKQKLVRQSVKTVDIVGKYNKQKRVMCFIFAERHTLPKDITTWKVITFVLYMKSLLFSSVNKKYLKKWRFFYGSKN